jgi:SAM-dependent methyltransferase
MTEQYCYTVGEQGQESLNILEKSFNEQTEYFLRKHGLRAGMTVLDIGCGLGIMTQIIATIVGESGKVVAIDNNDNQVTAAARRTRPYLTSIIEHRTHDVYNLTALNQKFDMVYCRFVLHHVNKPQQALQQISSVLKPSGIYIGIEGIMNYAYSYPEHSAWQSPNLPYDIAEGQDRNGNLGKILPNLINQAGMECIESAIFQPVLIKEEIRRLLINNECLDSKEYQINNGYLTEEQWQDKYDNIKQCVEDKNTLIAFYAGNFTASRKV